MGRMAGAAILVCALGGATVLGWLESRPHRASRESQIDSPAASANSSASFRARPAPPVSIRRLPDPLAFLSTAPPESLDLIPGVGPVLASRIVAARRANGRFRTWDDVDRVRGIGPKTIERWKALATDP